MTGAQASKGPVMQAHLKNKIGFWAGIVSFCLILWMPFPMPPEAKKAAAAAALMVVWWGTEAVPIAATSLVPLALYPVLSIMSADRVAKQYGDPYVFLFMGGFLLALAMQKSLLHKRIALHLIRRMGSGHRRMLAGFMLATAFISLFVSNTATTIMIFPIGMAVIGRLGSQKSHKFNAALMLGIAYASSIGGVATLIGKPTNMIFIGQSKNLLPQLKEVSFIEWSLMGVPVAAGFLVLTWFCLAFSFIGSNKKDGLLEEAISRDMDSLGKLSVAEIRVMIIFILTVLSWIWRADIQLGSMTVPGWTTLLGLRDVHDGTIAMMAALALFIVPAGEGTRGERLLDWEWAKRLPWEILFLFGGGFALAESFQTSGLAAWIAGGLSSLQGMPEFWLIVSVCFVTILLSELMSNTALVAMMMPILASVAGPLGIHPYLLMIPATIASSFAFMMPIGTPPNAIVYGSGHVPMHQMMKTGLVLNVLGVFWIALVAPALIKQIYGG